MNRVEYPNADAQQIIENLHANVAPTKSYMFALDRSRYQAQTAPTYQFVDISTALVAIANKSNTNPSSILETKFREYANKWYKEISGQSSLSRITSNENYLKIIKLGEEVVPFILKELKIKPAPWFLALKILTDESEVGRDFPGDFEKKADAWIRWGMHRGLA